MCMVSEPHCLNPPGSLRMSVHASFSVPFLRYRKRQGRRARASRWDYARPADGARAAPARRGPAARQEVVKPWSTWTGVRRTARKPRTGLRGPQRGLLRSPGQCAGIASSARSPPVGRSRRLAAGPNLCTGHGSGQRASPEGASCLPLMFPSPSSPSLPL